LSRQNIQQAAGNAKADFHETDEVGNNCADINNYSIKWAYENASESARTNYDKNGVKMVTGDDKGPYNAGPLWIWTSMKYTLSDDKKTMTVQSAMMHTPTNYLIKSAAGFHYCKVLSPLRVMEWIYVDSLYQFDGIKNEKNLEELFLQ